MPLASLAMTTDRDGSTTEWPKGGSAVLSELRATPDRIALATTDELILDLADLDSGADVVDVGRALLEPALPEDAGQVLARLRGGRFFVNLDVLFWRPWLALSPVDVLRQLGRANRQGVVARWPGGVSRCRATYSEPGRPDWCEERLADVLILRPCARQFPDQMPFEIERCLA